MFCRFVFKYEVAVPLSSESRSNSKSDWKGHDSLSDTEVQLLQLIVISHDEIITVKVHPQLINFPRHARLVSLRAEFPAKPALARYTQHNSPSYTLTVLDILVDVFVTSCVPLAFPVQKEEDVKEGLKGHGLRRDIVLEQRDVISRTNTVVSHKT